MNSPLSSSRVPAPFSLCQARCGERLRVVAIRSESSAFVRLHELGFCPSAEVCKVVDGGALICVMQGMRLAIARQLGNDVLVERIYSTAAGSKHPAG